MSTTSHVLSELTAYTTACSHSKQHSVYQLHYMSYSPPNPLHNIHYFCNVQSTWYKESLKAAIITRRTSIRFLSYSVELTTDFSFEPIPISEVSSGKSKEEMVG